MSNDKSASMKSAKQLDMLKSLISNRNLHPELKAGPSNIQGHTRFNEPGSTRNILNQKAYIPNLNVSRTIPPKLLHSQIIKDEPKGEPMETSDAEQVTAKPRERKKKTIIQREGIFSFEVTSIKPDGKNMNFKTEIGSKADVMKSLKRNMDELKLFEQDTKTRTFKDLYKQVNSIRDDDLVPVNSLPISVVNAKKKTVYQELEEIDKKEYMSNRAMYISEFEGMTKTLSGLSEPESDDVPFYLIKAPLYVPSLTDENSISDGEKFSFKGKQGQNITGYKSNVKHLLDGQIGKIKVYQSGKMKFVLGKCSFWLYKALESTVKEEVVLISNDEFLRNLGVISNRAVLIPNVLIDKE